MFLAQWYNGSAFTDDKYFENKSVAFVIKTSRKAWFYAIILWNGESYTVCLYCLGSSHVNKTVNIQQG